MVSLDVRPSFGVGAYAMHAHPPIAHVPVVRQQGQAHTSEAIQDNGLLIADDGCENIPSVSVIRMAFTVQ